MTQRLDPNQMGPRAGKAMQAMLHLNTFVESTQLEPALRELVKIRASQINGCAYCLHMHTHDARAMGESEDRMHLVAAWRESSLYTARERAALGWTEALTRLAETGAPDADYDVVAAVFSPEEQVELTLLINVINVWNRFAVGFRYHHPAEAGAAAA